VRPPASFDRDGRGFLVAAIPLSGAASEDIVRDGVQRSAAHFDENLTEAIATGLDPVRADELMRRFKLVMSGRPATWWTAPGVERQRLAQLGNLFGELKAAYGSAFTPGAWG
jgi:hypothetical protein